MTDPNFVSEEEWASWEAERAASNAAYQARREHERSRPSPTREDALAQVKALRLDNMRLLCEVDARGEECSRLEDRLLEVLDELEAAQMFLRLAASGLPTAGV